MVSSVIKYAVFIFIFIAILGGAYYSGYRVGSSDTKVEYVTKEIEVIKYVDKKKADIYSKPNLDKSALIKLMYDNKL